MQEITFQPNLPENSKPDSAHYRELKDEQGIAMILVMIVLSLLTMFSAYLFLSSVEDLRISDNSESMLQARFAARAGIEHAREVLRGLNFNDLLQGPDRAYSDDTTYLALARTAGFRNWASWATFRSLNIADPASAVSSLSDDGLINSGSGTILIPGTGVLFTATNPYGSGNVNTARYFLKITDNNGEATELGGTPPDNPFEDRDGTIIVRSVGVAGTVAEGSTRRNSVAIYEARFQQGAPFANLGSPAVVIGNRITANFSGNAFDIIGDGNGPGIGTIDTNTSPGDTNDPAQILRDATNGMGNITGNCPPPNDTQCIADITGTVAATSPLLDAEWLHNFVYNQVPQIRDYLVPDGGSVDSSNVGTPDNPKITYCEGTCTFTGDTYGAGLLVVKGNLTMGGAIRWDGLVLVIGSGQFLTHGMNRGIYGGLVVAGIQENSTTHQWEFTESNTDFDIRGNSNIATYNGSLSSMGNGLVPLKQLSFREVTSAIDP
jgi:hypothetical protein